MLHLVRPELSRSIELFREDIGQSRSEPALFHVDTVRKEVRRDVAETSPVRDHHGRCRRDAKSWTSDTKQQTWSSAGHFQMSSS